MQRRAFVKNGALALVTLGLNPTFLRRSVFAQDLARGAAALGQRRGKVLICLFQRGAADALNVVVPHAEAAYYRLRPTLAIPRPSRDSSRTAIDLDGFFGLHPSLSPFARLWKDGILAPVHAVGSPGSTRSHFDAQDYMERGAPDLGTRDGWLNRYLAIKGTCEECSGKERESHVVSDAAGSGLFRAISMTAQTPRILMGPEPSIAMSSIGSFGIRARGSTVSELERVYAAGETDIVHAAGKEMVDAMRLLRSADPSRYTPRNGAEYPRSPFGRRLLQIAQLIKADMGVEIAFADVGGWDTHANQGGVSGQLANRLSDFAASISALVTDLGDLMSDVVILTMSEFGRTARQNGSGGTDHGHAGCLFVIGGAVDGGTVHGSWPGLEREQLNEGRDLALTTDFRSVFGEVLKRHLGANSLESVFPGFLPTELGLFRG